MDKQILRKAVIRGTGIKKRARKTQHVTIDAYAITDEQALDKLKTKILETREQYRELSLNTTVILFDIERTFWNGYETISFTLFPGEKENYKEINLNW